MSVFKSQPPSSQASVSFVAAGILFALAARPVLGQVGVTGHSLSSPNATAISTLVDAPVNYYRGAASVSIPITRVGGRNLTIPVSLSYNGTGVKAEDAASWAGLGWSFSAGGVITRSVRALPDDATSGYLFSGHHLANTSNWNDPIGTLEDDILAGQIDPEPDVFYLSLPGATAQFTLEPTYNPYDGDVATILESDLSITYGTTGTPSSHIAWFEVTTADGTLYRFEDLEWTEDLDEVTTAVERRYVSSWYLSKIEDAVSSDVITFSYELNRAHSLIADHPVYFVRGLQRHVIGYGAHLGCRVDAELSVDKLHRVEELRLKGVLTATDSLVIYDTPTRQDIRNAITGNATGTQLELVDHFRNAARLRRVSLYHSYFDEALSTQSGNEPQYYVPKRLRLDSLRVSGSDLTHEGSYVFTYHQSDSLPSQYTYDLDHWGYYNGANNDTIFPSVLQTTNNPWDGADRSGSNAGYPFAGMLTKIVFPLGGYQEYEYERHHYSYVGTTSVGSTPGGGVRLKKISTFDGDSDAPLVREFSYVANGTSSGVINAEPDYVYYPYQDCSSPPDTIVVSRSLRSLGWGSGVGYSRVVEVLDGGGSGSVAYTFTTARDFPDEDVAMPSTGSVGSPTTMALRRGKLTSTTVYDASGTVRSRRAFTLRASDYDSVRGISFTKYGNDAIAHKYVVRRAHVYLDIDSTYVFDETGQNPATTRSTFTYDVDGTGHHQAIQSNVENTNGEVLVTRYDYANEEYPAMAALNMMSQVHSTELLDGPVTGAQQTLSKEWTTWGNATGSWLPQEKWVWDGTYAGTGPDDYEVNLTTNARLVESYDEYTHGKLSEYRGPADYNGNRVTRAIIWDELSPVPVTIAQNASVQDIFVEDFEDADVGPSGVWVDQHAISTVDAGSLGLRNQSSTSWREVSRDLLQGAGLAGFVLELDARVDEAGDFEIAVQGGSQDIATFGFSSSGTFAAYDDGNQASVPHSYQTGTYHHFRAVVDVGSDEYELFVDGRSVGVFGCNSSQPTSRIEFRDHNASAAATIDNIRLYPIDAQVTSSVYDPDTHSLLSTTDATGVTTQFDYDGFQRVTTVSDVDGLAQSTIEYAPSVTRNGAYDAVDPNYTRTTLHSDASSGASFTEDFSPHPQHWTEHDHSNGIATSSNTWTSPSGRLVHQYGGNATNWNGDFFAWDLGEELEGEVSIELSLIPDATSDGYSFGIAVGGDLWQPATSNSVTELAMWTSFDGAGDRWRSYAQTGGWAIIDDGFQSDSTYVLRMEIDTDPLNQSIDFYVNDVLEYSNRPFRSAVEGGIQKFAFFNYGKNTTSSTTWEVFDVTISVGSGSGGGGSAVVQTLFSDGLGRPVQSHLGGDTPIVYSQTLDRFGRPDTLVRNFGAASPGFNTDPIAAATTAYTGTPGHTTPFAVVEYDEIPGGVATQVSRLGNTGHVQNFAITTADLDNISTVARETTDEDGITALDYVDGFGNTVRTSRGNGISITDFEYDALGRLVSVVSTEGRVTEYAYDVDGHLVGMNTQDADGDRDGNPVEERIAAGTFDYEYSYDDRGRLRFERHPNHQGSDNTQFIYHKYDELDRRIESGHFVAPSTVLTFEDVRDDATGFRRNDQDWGGSYNQFEERFTYRGSQLRLGETAAGDSLMYEYDSRGRVAAVTVSLVGLTGEKTTEYTYDKQDRVVAIAYQRGSSDSLSQWFEYDDFGLLSQVSSRRSGDPTISTDATYAYSPAGDLVDIVLGNSAVETIDYEYDIAGRLVAVNDPDALGQDAFGQRLGYESVEEVGTALGTPSRLNGSVTWTSWATDGVSYPSSVVGYGFEYDALDRLVTADFGTKVNGSWGQNVTYDVGVDSLIAYDGDGNVETILRRDSTTSDSPIQINRNLHAAAGGEPAGVSNRISSITRSATTTVFSYDFNGNSVSDGVATTSFGYRDMPVSTTLGSTVLSYRYDTNGLRVYKSAGSAESTYYYVRGVDGQVVAVYDGNGTLRYWTLGLGAPIGRAFPTN